MADTSNTPKLTASPNALDVLAEEVSRKPHPRPCPALQPPLARPAFSDFRELSRSRAVAAAKRASPPGTVKSASADTHDDAADVIDLRGTLPSGAFSTTWESMASPELTPVPPHVLDKAIDLIAHSPTLDAKATLEAKPLPNKLLQGVVLGFLAGAAFTLGIGYVAHRILSMPEPAAQTAIPARVGATTATVTPRVGVGREQSLAPQPASTLTPQLELADKRDQRGTTTHSATSEKSNALTQPNILPNPQAQAAARETVTSREPVAPSGSLAAGIEGAVDAKDPATAPSASGEVATVVAPSDIPEVPAKGAIHGALGALRLAARSCLQGQRTEARAVLVFAANGSTQSVSVDGPPPGSPATLCLIKTLSGAKVGPFRRATFSVTTTITPP